MHAACQFVTGDAARKVGVARVSFQVLRVQPLKQIYCASIGTCRKFLRTAQIVRWVLRAEICSLKRCGQKSVAEIVLSTASQPTRIVDGYEGRQFLVFGS